MLNGLALCAGIGGLELGLKLALGDAYRCVGYVEREAYAAATLVARMEEKTLDKAPVWDDVSTFDGDPWRGHVDLVSGGYPCQPFSMAGSRRGTEDPRHLWPHISRILRQVRPTIAFFENVPGHISLGFREVHQDVQSMGFRVAAGVFSAEALGASHERQRLFILAHSSCERFGKTGGGVRRNESEERISGSLKKVANSEGVRRGPGDRGRFERRLAIARTGSPMGSPIGEGLEGLRSECSYELPAWPPSPENLSDWEVILSHRPEVEPAVRRVADGTSDWVDRLRACGNGVVPVVAAYAFRTLGRALGIVGT